MSTFVEKHRAVIERGWMRWFIRTKKDRRGEHVNLTNLSLWLLTGLFFALMTLFAFTQWLVLFWVSFSLFLLFVLLLINRWQIDP